MSIVAVPDLKNKKTNLQRVFLASAADKKHTNTIIFYTNQIYQQLYPIQLIFFDKPLIKNRLPVFQT
jgi:hypothetical protein